MPTSKRLWDALTSLKLTIASLVALMTLVTWCTLAQVELGTYGAVHKFMNCFIVWAHLPGTGLKVPVFPGGAAVGLVLMLNLIASQAKRLQLSWKKSGMWLVHAGLVLLLAGEFVASAFQVEMRMAIQEGETLNYIESPKEMELVITDVTDPKADDVFSVPEHLLTPGATIPIAGSPISVTVKDYYRNASLGRRAATDPASVATAGIGAQIAVQALPPATADDEVDQRAVFIEPTVAGTSFGTWLVSPLLGAPQFFFSEGHKYMLSMRERRQYLPFSLTLQKFHHDVYMGTDIPKNFSSQVHLSNPSKSEERDVLIFMNQPLRYDGKAFYQASFGEGDTLSIFQVVDNPGWLLPYIACALVALGLIIHFSISMRRGIRRQAALVGSEA